MTLLNDRPPEAEPEPELPEELTRVYGPRRGLLAKTIAVLILVFLIGVPLLVVLLTMAAPVEPEGVSAPAAQSAPVVEEP